MLNPWEEIAQPPDDLNVRLVDPDHPIDLYWGRDFSGHYLFIFEFDAKIDAKRFKFMDLKGIQSIYTPKRKSENNNRLILILRERSNWELFLSLCNDIKQATRSANNTEEAIQIILRRLLRWHEFLQKKPSGLLSEEKIKGLIGELLFLKNHLATNFGINQAVNFWHGPEGAPQDFNLEDIAIEAKCQAGGSVPHIRISSADQLCPQLPIMYLYVVTLGKASLDRTDTAAFNIVELVSAIRGDLENTSSEHLERFNDLLFLYDYVDSERYIDYSYILIGEDMYQITNNFPKICSQDLNEGIISLSYSISLAACEPFRKHPDWMEDIL